jgi:hypothetical protein
LGGGLGDGLTFDDGAGVAAPGSGKLVATGPGVAGVLTGGGAGVAGVPIGGGVGGGVAAAATKRAGGAPTNRSAPTALAVVTERKVRSLT